jgi:hypothetical protein
VTPAPATLKLGTRSANWGRNLGRQGPRSQDWFIGYGVTNGAS